jgi:SAM-dependent methyltransferase/RimJ/RimL family protein N-acetyltransferase
MATGGAPELKLLKPLAANVTLRPATAGDCALVHSWRNDPFIVANSTSRREVPWDEHRRWFETVLGSPAHLILIVLVDGEAAGLARFERADGAAVISVYLLQPFTGRGAGVEAISAASALCLGRWGLPVHALVRGGNAGARRAFAKAGFGLTQSGDAPEGHVLMVLSADGIKADWAADDAGNAGYYDDRVKRFGLDAKSADWASRETQTLRFKVLASVDRIAGRRILDVGCGTGEFLAWLRGEGIGVDYTGIDVSAGMAATARQRFPDVTILQGSVTDLPRLVGAPFDHVFASGIFTFRQSHPRAFVEAAVEAMFSLCTRSTSFNVLSAWAPDPEPGEFSLAPEDAIAIGRRYTSRLALRHDYHRGDMTLHLYRERPAA